MIKGNNLLKYSKRISRFGLVLSLLMGIILTNSSCEKDCNCVVEKPSTPLEDEYYVKYEVESSTIYSGKKIDATIKNENNTYTTFSISQGASWEMTIGPVQKGFTASLLAIAADTTYNKLKLNTYIYVSKNESPFALKQNDQSEDPRDSVEINYTIDY